jgi:hypothetical protein
VPHAQSVRLHQLLDKAGVRNQLLTIPGAGHGGFTDEQELKGYEAIKAFLISAGIAPEVSQLSVAIAETQGSSTSVRAIPTTGIAKTAADGRSE